MLPVPIGEDVTLHVSPAGLLMISAMERIHVTYARTGNNIVHIDRDLEE